MTRSNFCKGLNINWKRAKKDPKGHTKSLGPKSVNWDKISYIWPQKGLPGNPANSVHCTLFAHRAPEIF